MEWMTSHVRGQPSPPHQGALQLLLSLHTDWQWNPQTKKEPQEVLCAPTRSTTPWRNGRCWPCTFDEKSSAAMEWELEKLCQAKGNSSMSSSRPQFPKDTFLRYIGHRCTEGTFPKWTRTFEARPQNVCISKLRIPLGLFTCCAKLYFTSPR